MPTPISGLPAAGSAAGTDQVPANQSGTTRRVTLAQVLTYIQTTIGTPAGRALLTAVDAAAQRTALALGTAATEAATAFVSAATPRGAHTVLAGPASGSAAAPDFRALTAADGPGFYSRGEGGVLFDHFFNLAGNPTGPLAVSAVSTGTGGSAGIAAPPDASAFGLANLTAGSSGARGGFQSNAGVFRFGGILLRFEARFYLPSLLDLTETGAIYLGFGDSLSGVPVDGAYLYEDQTSANFRFRTRANNSETDVDSTMAAVAATWYRLAITVNAAGTSVDYRLTQEGGATVTQSIATTIPTGAGRETGIIGNIIKTGGTTTRALLVDWIRLSWGDTVN